VSRILIADDQRDVLEALRILLKGEGHQTESVTSVTGIFNALQQRDYALLMMDLNYARDTTSGQEGLEVIPKIQQLDSTLPIVVMTAWATIDLAVEAMKRGARDFVPKPWDNERLLTIVRTQIELASALRKGRKLEAANKLLGGNVPNLIADAPSMRPVIEMMTFNFSILALDQIVNSAAKMCYMSGGQYNIPLVIRGPGGPAAQLAAQHSQSMETYFYHVPGLKVVRPSTPADAKGLLKSAIRDDNPVIFIEAETLYAVKGEVPEDPDFLIPLGKAVIRREGTDVTVVAYMGMMYRALEVAEELAKDGISVEIVDPRTLRPMDTETIIGSVRKTHRAVVLEAGAGFAGMGSEIAAQITETAFDDLDAPVLRVTGENAPMPYAKNLELLKTPSKAKIAAAIRQVCNA